MTEKTTKPILILLGGELDDFPIVQEAYERIIAADSGAAHALRQGVLPDIVVGDFDSLGPEDQARLRAGRVATKRLPTAKDLTDGQAAVDLALSLGARRVVLAGGLGDRFDHSLGNVLLLHRVHRAGASGWVTDGRQRVYLLDRKMEITGDPGDQLSIVPLSGQLTGVSVSGVRWPLSAATLHLGETLSLSNELTEPIARLTVEEGLALVVVTSQSLAK